MFQGMVQGCFRGYALGLFMACFRGVLEGVLGVVLEVFQNVFLGFNASNEELGLKAQSIWAFTTNDSGKNLVLTFDCLHKSS